MGQLKLSGFAQAKSHTFTKKILGQIEVSQIGNILRIKNTYGKRMEKDMSIIRKLQWFKHYHQKHKQKHTRQHMENDNNYWIFCTNENSEKSWRTFKNWAIAPWRPGDPSKITSTHSRNGFVTPTIVDLSICHQFLHCIEVQLCQAQSSIYHLHLEFPIICIIMHFYVFKKTYHIFMI